MLNALLALASAIIAGGSFFYFQRNGGGTLWLVLGIVFLILAVVFGIIFMSSRINKTEDIHITE